MEKWLQLFDTCSGVCTDTRQIKQDVLYIALKGANFDGNAFAKEALAAGAKYAIVDNSNLADDKQVFYVPDGLVFLQELAKAHRLRFAIPVIGITGSNGKTSTKELVNAVLSTQFKVLCTEGNLNNHIGVPLTLLQIKAQHEIAIIEMGANKPFDIDELCRIALPNYGLITNIGKAHLEGFINYEGVLKTKSELYDHVQSNDGKLFVNTDDPVLKIAAEQRKTSLLSYGQENAELSGQLAFLDPFVHFSWRYENYQSDLISTHLVGKYNFVNFLAALRVGLHFGITPENCNKAIANYIPTNKRSQVEKTARNTIIVDCYNANPSSMMSALTSFVDMVHAHKIAILGDMLELGADGPAEHQKILDFLVENKLNFITVGPIFKQLHPEGFENTAALKITLEKAPLKNKLLLLKGSRGIALEQLMEVL
ncbi:MAG: UDP-N-acetylmuramoyl-tripeptide--D-alanyl-D-alanine ligase [Flavobacteriales bacterium]